MSPCPKMDWLNLCYSILTTAIASSFFAVRGEQMSNKERKDYQTLSLFLILGVLTIALVFLLKVVLFSPTVALTEMATKF